MDFSLSLPELSEATNLRPTWAGASSVGSVAIKSILGVQDEAAIKKQNRMIANRMSAQRSRLRKLAECDELKRKVETLGNENQNLRNELQRLSEECKKLTSENNYLRELVMRFHIPQTPNTMSKADNDAPPCRIFFR